MRTKYFTNLRGFATASSVVVALFISACSQPYGAPNADGSLTMTNDHLGIIGGQPVPANSAIAASTVFLWDVATQSSCSGTLYKFGIVVTAAHCLQTSPENLRVIFARDAQTALTNPQVARKVLALRVDPNYCGVGCSDVGVLRYSGSTPSGYQPALRLQSYPEVGQEVVVAGYGMSDAISQTGVGILRAVSLSLVSSNETYAYTVNMSGGTGMCFGDSGGPAFIKKGNLYYAWGVASGVNSDYCNDHGFYDDFRKGGWTEKTAIQLLGDAYKGTVCRMADEESGFGLYKLISTGDYRSVANGAKLELIEYTRGPDGGEIGEGIQFRVLENPERESTVPAQIGDVMWSWSSLFTCY